MSELIIILRVVLCHAKHHELVFSSCLHVLPSAVKKILKVSFKYSYVIISNLFVITGVVTR